MPIFDIYSGDVKEKDIGTTKPLVTIVPDTRRLDGKTLARISANGKYVTLFKYDNEGNRIKEIKREVHKR